MTCHEFIRQIEGFTRTEVSSPDAEMLAHQSGCASCAALLRERNALAGAMRLLRDRTSAMEAPTVVEQNVLRAFRHGSAVQPASATERLSALWLSAFFGWRAYAAVAAVLAIGLGLGLWFAQHSKVEQQPTAKTEPLAQPSAGRTKDAQQLPVQASMPRAEKLNSATNTVVVSSGVTVTPASLTQSEMAQGYTPLMLCDPISCSGDEEVVRMELPATSADGSSGSQMADVIVGDDGLVRAIRIVQQQ